MDLKALWRRVETELGLPEDETALHAYYANQRVLYEPWNQKTFCPDWTLAEGKCNNCEAETLVVRAGGMNLCVMWCLITPVPHYPSGVQHPTARDFLRHAKMCKRDNASTLHSWSLTSKYSESLKTAFMSSNPMAQKTPKSPSMSSLTEKEKTVNKSSSGLPLPNLVLLSRQ